MYLALAPLLDLYPHPLRSDMAEALDELLRDAIQLAREVADAEARGRPFADAVRDDASYPLMARVHAGLPDLLQTELASEERGAIEQVIDRAAHSDIDAVRRSWFLLAADADDGEALTGALMRFLLFQAIRLNVWVLTWRDGAPLEAAGSYRALDVRAERTLRDRLAMDEMLDPAVRPLQVLVAEALEELAGIWAQQRRELASARPEQTELFANLTRAAQIARDLGAADAALVRNELSGATGGGHLGSRELAARHPLLQSQNATDQRRRRLLARLRGDTHPVPSGARLIDLIGSR